MPLMSYREYARHRKCTLRAVQKAVGEKDAKGQRDGRIAAALVSIAGSQHPKIDSQKADELWALNTDEAKRSPLYAPSAAALTGGLPGYELAARGADELPDDAGRRADDVPEYPAAVAAKRSYHESRAQRARIDAENAQLDLDMRKGNVIELEAARRLGFTTLRSLRDALDNVGARIAAQVAALSDPFACEQLISAEIRAAQAGITPASLLTEVDEDESEGE